MSEIEGPQPRPGLREVEPYQAPQLDVPVRLNTNECPYPLPDGFFDDLDRRLREMALNRYPDREAVALRSQLGERAGISTESVWVASGSNEVIQQALQAYGGQDRTVLVFEPTYPLYSQIAWVMHTEVRRVEVEPPYALTPEHVDAAREAQADVTFVCSPNNPTGNAQPVETTEALARACRGLVVVDEAYVEFGGKSAAGLVESLPNLVVVRTFSKAFALAGARLGYCLAAPDVIEDLRRVRLPYHVSALTQAAGLAALSHAEEAMAILDAVRRERDRLCAALSSDFDGLEAFPSDANFVLFRPPKPAAEVWYGLLDHGVLVRDLSKAVPNCLRVSAGTPEEVDRFLEALREVLA